MKKSRHVANIIIFLNIISLFLNISLLEIPSNMQCVATKQYHFFLKLAVEKAVLVQHRLNFKISKCW